MASINKACVIGSGLIGRCWAALFARAGLEVRLFDIDEAQVTTALDAIRDIIAELHDNDLLRDQTVDEVLQRVSGSSNLGDAVGDADYVQECVPEVLDIKRKVFEQLDEVVKDSCILASSTSCIAPSKFTHDLKHSANCIVAHPVNPPHYIPVVEVVPAPWTSELTIETTRAFQLRLGQAPVVLRKEVNGFIINRLQYALLMEAWRLVEDGVATPQDVDTAVSQGLGLRWSFMGPFETIDLNAPGGVVDYCNRYGDTISAVCREQEDTRAMKGTATAATVHAAMRQDVPEDQLKSGARRAWRDRRLAALAVHKHKQAQVEQAVDDK
ncbi:hypothetical protein PTSG_04984 [Salpingoeca rosetta]|uniref:3-hydroxyacyl-CoA dehydrogenase n=1 Tax=Salpingoeca rosetta (strain ATCC 50818 / BSB-021) TaxID=946362 RepID=F2U967_SALR5|nr:uncharacterized protein PTSG_04984 [Salpingoeca rosetta]EGD73270.1 hypothetical protein PTSG_04984 [Salpingoeca rosetta]|eukprot:XP_004994301.1 hypothetical protein PTSG_04984 [Salpingoeca rosetta]